MAGLIAATATLPPVDWRVRAGMTELTQALGAESGVSRFVGGAVRDTLLGLPVSDVDIATRLAPGEVVDALKSVGIKSVPTGLAHGTVTAVLASGPVEVTTLRRDVSTDGRHAVVAFTDDWRQDATRRDFTINALYADPLNGEVFDYFGGIADLAARRIRFIGDPLQRIAEDHLRILRFFRFVARFDDAADPVGLDACAARANDLMALSRERIADELLKLLKAQRAPSVIALMLDRGILAPILPEIDAAGIERLVTLAGREERAGIPADPVRRLAALLPRDPTIADQIGARLKLSNAQRKRLAIAVDPARSDSARAMAYRLGPESAIDRLLLRAEGDDPIAALAPLVDWTPPRLPIGGGVLVARGLKKGPDVARTLRVIEDQWIAEGFPGDARLASITDAAIDQALRSTSS